MLKLSPTKTIIRGDSDRFQITFTKKVQDKVYPIDITGWNIKFTVRKEVPDTSIEDDVNALIAETAVILDAEKGTALIYVQAEQTTKLVPGEYLYDIQIIKPEDEQGHHQVVSIRRGKYIVLGDITRDESYTPINNSNYMPPMEDIYNSDDSDDDADDGYSI